MGEGEKFDFISQVERVSFLAHVGSCVFYITIECGKMDGWRESAKSRVVSEHEHARVSEFNILLEFRIMLTRVSISAHEERLRHS